MKRFYSLAFLFMLMLGGLNALANRVIVKGSVKYANGNPAPNRKVIVATDTLANSAACRIYHVKYTSNLGYFSDTMECPNNIVKLRITTENCDGTLLVQEPQVSPSGIVEVSFIICNPIVPLTGCVSNFTFERSGALAPVTVKFNSTASHGVSATDAVISWKWTFGNGSASTIQNPVTTYVNKGSYQVCLTIRTASGCEKTECKTIGVDSAPPPPLLVQHCVSRFVYAPQPSTSAQAYPIKFNSSTSETILGDEIRERIWSFGDGTGLTGNVKDPIHVYTHDGVYTVCLTIKTAKGCEVKECKQIVVTRNASPCAPQYTFEKVAPKKIRFNSGMSYVSANDSIVERKWEFGDGTTLGGNVVSPLKEYLNHGVYTACLSIKTKSGCVNKYCNTVRVGDTLVNPPASDPIKIVSLYPNPASVEMKAVVFSLHNNITAEIGIYDIYGVKKWGMSKVLLQGDNITVVPVNLLLTGPYFFKVTTMYGVRSRQFYKL